MLYLLLFISLATAAPLYHKNITVTTKFFPDSFVIYTGTHDIVEISIPLNELNNDSPTTIKNEPGHSDMDYIFFVEADRTSGVRDYKGTYVFKKGQAKKILENGQTVTYGDKKTVYIGASDGIYKYNHDDDTVKKFGSETRSVIKMAINVHSRQVYYLTSDYVLYKFDDGTFTTTEVPLKDVRDFVFSYKGNLFYFDGSKQVYVYDGENVLKIERLPAAQTKIALVRTVTGYEAYAVVDSSVYGIDSTGAVEFQNVILDVQPTAYAPDLVYFQYYAYKKKIYDYNLLRLGDRMSVDDVNELLAEKEDKIKTIAKSGHTKQF